MRGRDGHKLIPCTKIGFLQQRFGFWILLLFGAFVEQSPETERGVRRVLLLRKRLDKIGENRVAFHDAVQLAEADQQTDGQRGQLARTAADPQRLQINRRGFRIFLRGEEALGLFKLGVDLRAAVARTGKRDFDAQLVFVRQGGAGLMLHESVRLPGGVRIRRDKRFEIRRRAFQLLGRQIVLLGEMHDLRVAADGEAFQIHGLRHERRLLAAGLFHFLQKRIDHFDRADGLQKRLDAAFGFRLGRIQFIESNDVVNTGRLQ